MEATMVSDTPKHYPVLLRELISILSPQHGGTFIDCTFGQGGYSKEILKYDNTQVIAFAGGPSQHDRKGGNHRRQKYYSRQFHGSCEDASSERPRARCRSLP